MGVRYRISDDQDEYRRHAKEAQGYADPAISDLDRASWLKVVEGLAGDASAPRSELVINWNLPQNASITETNAQIAQFEREQLQDNPAVDHWSTYVGTSAVCAVVRLADGEHLVRPDGRRH